MRRLAQCVHVVVALLLGAAMAGAENPLPEPAADAFQQDVAWSADGEWIAFSEFADAEYAPEK